MSGAFDIRFIFHWNIKCRFDFRFQHSRKCHGFRRVTFRIASHDCTTEKSRDGFSEGKAKARRWSDLPGKSLTTEPLRTSTRTTGPGVPQWATTNSRSRKNKIRPQAKEISAMIRLEKTKKGGRVGLEAKMADSTTASCFLETYWTQNLL